MNLKFSRKNKQITLRIFDIKINTLPHLHQIAFKSKHTFYPIAQFTFSKNVRNKMLGQLENTPMLHFKQPSLTIAIHPTSIQEEPNRAAVTGIPPADRNIQLERELLTDFIIFHNNVSGGELLHQVWHLNKIGWVKSY